MKKILLIFFSFAIPTIAFSQTWTGNVSTAWDDTGNWATGVLPTSATDATIPTSPAGGRFPTISSGTATVKDLIIQAGATVSQTGGTLQVSNEWKNSGTYNSTGGTVQFVGNGGGGTTFAAGTNNFYHVIVNSGINPEFDNVASSNLNIAGDFTNNNASLANQASSSTFTFNGMGDQSFYTASANTICGNLVVNKASGMLSQSSAIKVINLTLTSGSYSTGASNYSLTATGNATLNGGTINLNASTVAISGTLTTNGGTISGTTCAITVTGDFTRAGGSYSISGGTLSLGGNLTNNASGTLDVPVTFTGSAKTINGSVDPAFGSVSVTGTVTMNRSSSASSFTIPANATATSLSIASGVIFTVNGDVTLNQPTASVVAALNVNAGTVNVSGSVNIGGNNTTTGRVAKVVITTGTLDITGDLVYNSATSVNVTAVVDMAGGAGNLKIAGSISLTNSSGTLTPGTTSTVEFYGTGAQTVTQGGAISYRNIKVNKSSGTVSLASALTIAGNLQMEQGTFNTTASDHSLTVGGLVLNGGNLNLNNSTVTINGNYSNSGTAISGGSSAITVTGDFTLGGGSFAVPSGTLSIGGNWTNNLNSTQLSISAVTLTGALKTISGSSSTSFTALNITGSVTMNTSCSAASFTIPANATATSLSIGSGITFTVNGDITINQPTASVIAALNVNAGTVNVTGNVNIGGSNTTTGRVAKVVVTTGTFDIAGNLVYNSATAVNVTAAVDLSGGAGTLRIAGSVVLTNNSGTLTPGASSTFEFYGTAAQTVVQGGAISYNGLKVNKTSGTVSLGSALSISGDLQMQQGTFSTSASNYALTVGGLLLNGGTLDLNNSTVTVNGSYNNSGTAVTGGSCAVSVSGDFTWGGGTYSTPSGSLSVDGNWTNNYAATVDIGSVTFTGTSKTIGGSVATSFPALTLTTGTVTANTNFSCTSLTLANNSVANYLTLSDGISVTVNGNVTINQASANTVVHSVNVNGGTMTVNGDITLTVTTSNAGRQAKIAVTTGTLNINGNLTISNTLLAANAVIDMSGGAGNLNLSGDLNVTSLGTLTPGTSSTFTLNGSSNQTITQASAISYNNVRVNKTGGTASIGANMTINGTLTVDAGSFSTGTNYSVTAAGLTVNGGSLSFGNSALTISGDVVITGGTVTGSAGTISVAGNWTRNGGTYSGGTTSISFTGSSKTIDGSSTTSFGNISFGAGSSYTMNNRNSCTGLTLNASATAVSFTQGTGTTLTVNGDVTINQPTASSITIAWNINDATATVSGNINIGNTNTTLTRVSKVVITTGTLNITGNLVFNSSVTTPQTAELDMSGGAGILNLSGSIVLTNSTGTLTPGSSSKVVFTGTSAQTLIASSNISFNTIEVNKASNSVSLGAATTLNGDFILTSGTFNTAGYDLTFGGNWTNNGGTFSYGATSDLIIFNGASQSINGTASTTFPTIQIADGANVSMYNNNTCYKFEFLTSATSNSSAFTHIGNASLTVNNVVYIRQRQGTAVTTAWNINAGSATVNSTLKIGTGDDYNNTGRVAKIVITTGTLNINSNLVFHANPSHPGNAVLDMSGGAGVVNITGSVTTQSGGSWQGTITPGTTSTFNFNGTSAQTISFGSQIKFNHININNTAGVTASAAFTSTNVTGNLRVLTGFFDNGGFSIAGASGKTFEVANGATFYAGGTSGMVTGFTTKTFGVSSTVNYDGTTQTVSAEAYGNLTLSGSGTKTMPGSSFTVAGNLTTSGTASASAGNAITVGGNVVLGSGTTFGAGSYTHNVAGNWTNNGATFNASTSTINLNGTVAQTISGSSATSFNNLTVSNSTAAVSVTVNTNVSGTLNMNGANTLLSPSAAVVFNNAGAAGTITGSGTIQVSRTAATADYSNQYKFTTNTLTNLTVDYSGAGAQSVNAFTYGGLKFSGSGTKTASGNITVNNTLTLAAATFAVGSYTLTVKSNITRTSGSVDATAGTIVFNGTSAQTVSASVFSTAINNLTINNSAGVTMGANHTVSTLLTLTAGTLDIGTTTATINGSISRTSGNMNVSSGTLVFSGSSAQTIPTSAFTGNINNITINNATGVSIAGDHTIAGTLALTAGTFDIGSTNSTITGSISRTSGNINGSSATMIFAGSSAQTIPANAFLNNALKNLRMSNSSGVSLEGTLGITDVFSFGSVNNATFSAGGYLNLKSTASNTARVADVTNNGANSGNTISGNVVVERYFPNDGRRYRLITPGATTTSTIRTNWMEGGLNTELTDNVDPNPGYGTQITGSGHNANGFDITQTNNPSLFTYNQSTGAWVAVSNTNGTLSANQPYLIFIRGDRSVNMAAPGAPISLPGSATTLRATGVLQFGTQSANSLCSNGGFSLVSNPYASPISWSGIHGNNSSNFEDYYTYWEPKVGTRGAYVTVTTGGLKSNPSSNATVEIQGGQAFFVKTKSGVTSPSLTFREVDKSTTSNINVFRQGVQTEMLYTSLFFRDALGTRYNADGVLSAYNNQYSKKVNSNDAVQISNWDEDVAILREGKALSIETRPLIDEDDTVFLAMSRMKLQEYEWQFEASNFNAPGMNAFLNDSYLGTATQISLSGLTVVTFEVGSDPASAASGRFFITFRAAAALPVTLVKFTGKRAGDDNVLSWKATSEENFDHYEVEHSTDERSYRKIGSVQAKGAGRVETDYTFTHRDVAGSRNLYRLKMVDQDGKFSYSPVVLIGNNTGDINIDVSHVYPNPFADELNVTIHSASERQGQIFLLDMQGRVMRKLPVKIQKGSTSFSLQNLQALGAGTYMLSVRVETFEFSTKVLKGKK